MKIYIKQGILATLYTLLLIGILYGVTALILLKNGFDFNLYFYVAAGLQFIIAAVLTIIFKKQKPLIAVVPMLVLDMILMLIFRAFSIKTIIVCISIIVIHVLLIVLSQKHVVLHKSNSNKLRRRYEKIRKKQYH